VGLGDGICGGTCGKRQSPRMLKKAASFVLTHSEPATYLLQYVSVLHSLRPRWTAFLNILHAIPDIVLSSEALLACRRLSRNAAKK
jgi:hypothetical protein